MSLLTWCSCIPSHFHLSSISCSMLSHCHMQHQLLCHATSCMTCVSLHNHSCLTLALIGPITSCTISPVSHIEWTDGPSPRPHCTLSISSQVPHHSSYFDLLFCILMFHMVLSDGSGKAPNLPCHRLTGHKTHHTMQLYGVFPHGTIT